MEAIGRHVVGIDLGFYDPVFHDEKCVGIGVGKQLFDCGLLSFCIEVSQLRKVFEFTRL